MNIKWIAVADALPADGDKVIVWLASWCRWTTARRHGSTWRMRAKDRDVYYASDVTHWLDPLRPDYDEINGEE